jgi:enamine deaminase RidA (YjgF/YER057c/UK114 family)
MFFMAPSVVPASRRHFDRLHYHTLGRHATTHLSEDAMRSLSRYLSGFCLFAAGTLVGLAIHSQVPETGSAFAQDKATGSAEERLKQLKIELPPVTKPTNTLVNAVRVGDMLYVSGTGPALVNGKMPTGRLGQDLDTPKGRAVARSVGLQILAVVKAELGSLDKVQRLVKTLGMVNSTPDFTQQPQVINGFSDLMVEVFGEENGKGARSAVGMAALPSGIPVEIEAIFQVRK